MALKARRVVQCDLSGKMIRYFISAKEAAESLGSKWPASINKAAKYGLTFRGYRWRFEGEELVTNPKGTPGAKRKVIAVNLDTKVEQTFPSISEASRRLGIRITSIESALQTGGNTKGYSFYYLGMGPMPKEKKKRICRSVRAIDEEGNVIKEWPTVSDAAKELGVIDSAIYGCLNRKNPNARCKGYRLRYKPLE